MTVSSVTSSSSHAFAMAAEPADGSINGMAAQVALLMLETQESQKENDRAQLSLAREEYSAALSDEVAQLKSAADAAFRGAALQASLVVAGAGISCWGVGRNLQSATWQEKAGEALDHAAAPLGSMAGKTYGTANAKAAEGAETAAKWQLDDAKQAIDDASTKQGKALDWLSSMVDKDAATMAAILSNKV